MHGVDDPVGTSTKHEHGGDCPKNEDWHGYAPTSCHIDEKNSLRPCEFPSTAGAPTGSLLTVRTKSEHVTVAGARHERRRRCSHPRPPTRSPTALHADCRASRHICRRSPSVVAPSA